MTKNDTPLYLYQERVYQAIRAGKNVILQAPTGSGKTRAALIAFLENLAKEGNCLPYTCRYAVPLRVLANQFEREYRDQAKKIDRARATLLEQTYRARGIPPVAIQTGEQPDDPQLEAMITFCTIDQLLASALAVPYSLGRKKANLNVAGVLGSYLVLDEFHLYPLGKELHGARGTIVQILCLLKETTRFVLMTATFSTKLLKELATLLDAVVIKVEDEGELALIAQGRTRTFWRKDDEMDAAGILDEHRSRPGASATLVVCNTVKRARKMYLKLRLAEAEGTRVILLHSRFRQADRAKLTAEMEEALGPNNWDKKMGAYQGPDIIVVATQVVEVGLNISVHVLHTEIAPASSLIQRAGRCARFACQQGIIRVYQLPLEADGKRVSALPYDQGLCDRTYEELGGEAFQGQMVDFSQEQMLIDAIHAEEDQKFLAYLERYRGITRQKIFQTMKDHARDLVPDLIRNVTQVQVLVHDNPNSAITESPWEWESFGIHPGSLSSPRVWDALVKRAEELRLDVICWSAEPAKIGSESEDLDNRERPVYQWKPVSSSKEFAGALWIAFPPELASYDARLGFVLLDDLEEAKVLGDSNYRSVHIKKDRDAAQEDPGEEAKDEEKRGWKKKVFGAKEQSYQQHIEGLVRAYDSQIRVNMSYMARKLELALGVPDGTVEQATRLAIACHDLGKLDQTWQQWALEWQEVVYPYGHQGLPYPRPDTSYCFAKTDYDRDLLRMFEKQVKTPRPNHACESVMLGRTLIGRSLGVSKEQPAMQRVLRAVCGAIAHHHTSRAHEYGATTLVPAARQAAAEALEIARREKAWSYDVEALAMSIKQGGTLSPDKHMTWPGDDSQAALLETWLYFLLVRTLRLADQRAG